jgi:sugar phosphate isomerase/epimerase
MMDIGLGCGMFLDSTLPELIEIAARHGFPHISARPWAFTAALETGHSEQSLRRLLKDAGVRVTMMDALTKGMPGVHSPPIFDEAIRATLPPDALAPPDQETCLRSAEVLEAPYVNVSLFRGARVPLPQMADAVGDLCRRAAMRGIAVTLEFYPDSGLPDLEFAREVVVACGESNCAITLDVWHLARSGGTVQDIRRLPPGVIAGIQLSDRIAPLPGAPYVPFQGRLFPGEGELPLGEIIRAALDNSPLIRAEIEVLDQELRSLSADAVAARTTAALARWRQNVDIPNS